MTSQEAVALVRQHHRVPDDAKYVARIWRDVGFGRMRLAVSMSSKEWTLPGMMPSPTDPTWWYCIELPYRPKADKPVMLDAGKARDWVYRLEES